MRERHKGAVRQAFPIADELFIALDQSSELGILLLSDEADREAQRRDRRTGRIAESVSSCIPGHKDSL